MVMSRRKDVRKKRRTRAHVIADLAMNYLERLVLLSGHTLQRVTHDYGLDAALTTYNGKGEVENGVIWLQLKATDHVQEIDDGRAFALRVQRKDLLYWLGEQYPVIVVLYDAAGDRAFWLHVQDDFAGGKVFELARAGASMTCHVRAEQLLTTDAIQELRRVKAQAQRQWQRGGPNG
jgi:hypothetical protein